MIEHAFLKELNKQPERISQLEYPIVSEILNEAKKGFRKQDFVLEFKNVEKKDEIYVLGDIHGSWDSLAIILKDIEKNDPRIVISLGDIVDRGAEQLKCLMILLILKILEPDRYFILRGNHETEEMNAYYGFLERFIDKYGDMNKFLEILSVYEALPYCAVINNEILCLHGGIPEEIQAIDQLRKLNKKNNNTLGLKNLEETLFQIMWNDPKESDGYFFDSFRGPGIKFFGKDAFQEFMEFYDLKLLIRAHECFSEGYRWFFDKKLLSIFSAANYRTSASNPGTYAIIKGGDVKVRRISL